MTGEGKKEGQRASERGGGWEEKEAGERNKAMRERKSFKVEFSNTPCSFPNISIVFSKNLLAISAQEFLSVAEADREFVWPALIPSLWPTPLWVASPLLFQGRTLKGILIIKQ
uniref:Uncharacterized protein n=1 Tax=Micrurus lemniscatus lemniscatus TaxID=129467 RepID=A0A2D4I0M1_MICLE